MSRSALDDVVARYRAEPSRIWSLVITVFGDAIVPRGGSVWLGTLLALFRALGLEEGAVRTAMSRLTADGWLERTRVGRRSFYELAARGRTTFAEATEHIYNLDPPGWNGRLRLLLPDPEADRDAERSALGRAGFGSLAPTVFVAPAGTEVPAGTTGAISLEAEIAPEDARRLAGRAWPIDRMAGSYRDFIATFRPLSDALPDLACGAEDAILARILLVHAYRRINLRDPILPAALLPPDWPGRTARALCAGLYLALLPASECWLDTYGADRHGPLPPAGPDLRSRFA